MSADNWAICPRCNQQEKEIEKAAENHIKNSYGKMPSQEWLSLKREFEEIGKEDQGHTLEENFDFILDRDGIFTSYYKAHCGVCDFSFDYECRKTVKF